MNREIIDKLFEIKNVLTEIEHLLEITTKYFELSEEDYSKITIMFLIMQNKVRLLQELDDSIFGLCKDENYSPK